MIKCIQCKTDKRAAEFYRHPYMTNGRMGVCKVCHKDRMWKNRRESERAREYDRHRYYNDPERKKHTQDNAIRWRKKNPAGYKAHTAVNNAVRDGRLKKEPCGKCGSTHRINGHHNDYSKPFDVIWLCAKCHHRGHADGTF